ncbi:MAG: PQQ-binding-like beta-propeller repeat protein, partial [Candidatus Methanofastidiosum sp.]|nr:PQQ-binding-like beta-propeller repeat protein [Methanofastidiosum sp.]HRZ18887.1 hypothetical protein [Methanofastidiosum sp.]
MKKYISIFFILCIVFSTTTTMAEDAKDPIIWKYKTSSWVISTATTDDQSYTSASALDGSLYFFDKTGNLLWNKNTGHRVVSLTFSKDYSKISAVTGERIYLIDKSGKALSDYKTVQGSYMVINQDGNYIGGSSSNIYAILYKDARPEWDYKTGDKINAVSITP